MGSTCLLLLVFAAVQVLVMTASWRLARMRQASEPAGLSPHAKLNNDEVEILCVLLEEAMFNAQEQPERRMEFAVMGDLLHRLTPLTPTRGVTGATTLPRSIRLGRKGNAAPNPLARF